MILIYEFVSEDGRASWSDARRYAELWNAHKVSTTATLVGGVVCVVDGVMP